MKEHDCGCVEVIISCRKHATEMVACPTHTLLRRFDELCSGCSRAKQEAWEARRAKLKAVLERL